MKKREIVVVAFIYNDKNEFLATQRSENKNFLPNMWELVGGRTDFGEDCVDGLKREVKEEVGIDIIVEEPFYAISFMRDEETDAIEVIYFAKMEDSDQEIKIKEDEIQNYKWLTEENFAEYYDKNLPEFQAIKKAFKMIKSKI